MEKCSFFNDVNNDRVYYAEDFARHLATYFTNGIFNNGCLVTANDNMTVNVKKGSANINGYRYDNDDTKILTIENADGVLNRIDNVVIRLDLTNRLISTQVIKGTFADNPIAPDIVRTSTIYDLRIAKISIPAGTTTITQNLITDTRFLTSECGNVICAVETPDTENLFIQIQSEFENQTNSMDATFSSKMTNYDTSFNQWFNTVKDIIDEETATQLYNEITKINTKIPTKTSQLTNDSDFATNTKVNQLENKINNPDLFKFVDTLPTVGEEQKIYCVSSETPEENNLFDEYIFKNNAWEKIGSAKIDTSEFLKGATANSIEQALQISTANTNELKVVLVLGEEVQNETN